MIRCYCWERHVSLSIEESDCEGHPARSAELNPRLRVASPTSGLSWPDQVILALIRSYLSRSNPSFTIPLAA